MSLRVPFFYFNALHGCMRSVSCFVASSFERLSRLASAFASRGYCCRLVSLFQNIKNKTIDFSNNKTAKRFFLDVEVISESTLVVFTGGPGAVIWMALTFLVLMGINIFSSLHMVNSGSAKANSGMGRVLYALGMFAVTIYTTVLFQTKQVAFSMPDVNPWLLVGALSLIVCALLLVHHLMYLLYATSVAVVIVYVIGATNLLFFVEDFMIDSIRNILANMWSSHAMLCGYLGACAIGSYILNIKSADRIKYDKVTAKERLVFYNVLEYTLTAMLCVITGIVVAGLSDSHHALHKVIGEPMLASIMVGKISVFGPWVMIAMPIIVIVTEAYYVHKHWLGVLSGDGYVFKNKLINFFTMYSPLLTVVAIVVVATTMRDLDVMPFVNTSDGIIGLTVFFPIGAMLVNKFIRNASGGGGQASVDVVRSDVDDMANGQLADAIDGLDNILEDDWIGVLDERYMVLGPKLSVEAIDCVAEVTAGN